MMTPTESTAEAEPIRSPMASREWTERCGTLFEALRGPARAMLFKSFGAVLSDEEIEDVYSAAWAATLSALRGREERLGDDELRAYVLTAVASHARKELRRRSRKPTSTLNDAHAQMLTDEHDPLPDERTIDSESGTITRDVLGSLPPRRRAVMLLRYGWGLQPKEICALVANLSPRAYRKEITRGVEQMIERLKQVETGEWCESREPVLRDYVSGTGGEDVQRQALQHMAHCRHCSEFVARLTGTLHELGGSIAWVSVAGAVGGDRVSLADRLGAAFDRGREGAHGLAERAEAAATTDTATTLAASGGARGAGAAGAGVMAKLAGLGTLGKAAIACIGAGAAATACVATGVVPGVDLPWSADPPARESGPGPDTPNVVQPSPLTGTPSADAVMEVAGGGQSGSGESGGDESGSGGSKTEPVKTAPEGAPASSPAPTAPPVDQQFVVPSTATTDTTSAGGTAGGSGTSGGTGASGGDISKEFGP